MLLDPAIHHLGFLPQRHHRPYTSRWGAIRPIHIRDYTAPAILPDDMAIANTHQTGMGVVIILQIYTTVAIRHGCIVIMITHQGDMAVTTRHSCIVITTVTTPHGRMALTHRRDTVITAQIDTIVVTHHSCIMIIHRDDTAVITRQIDTTMTAQVRAVIHPQPAAIRQVCTCAIILPEADMTMVIRQTGTAVALHSSDIPQLETIVAPRRGIQGVAADGWHG